jgi:hypothetical protein
MNLLLNCVALKCFFSTYFSLLVSSLLQALPKKRVNSQQKKLKAPSGFSFTLRYCVSSVAFRDRETSVEATMPVNL